jgi:hypothetical protein
MQEGILGLRQRRNLLHLTGTGVTLTRITSLLRAMGRLRHQGGFGGANTHTLATTRCTNIELRGLVKMSLAMGTLVSATDSNIPIDTESKVDTVLNRVILNRSTNVRLESEQ